MNAILISYDLHRPGQDYKELHEAIKILGSWWHCLESVWIVDTAHTVSGIRDHLRQFVDANDSVLVLNCGGSWATLGMSKDCNAWLREHVSRTS